MTDDSWIEQEDLLARLRRPSDWLRGQVCIHQELRSYVEDLYWTLVLLPRRFVPSVLDDYTWGDDVRRERFRLVRTTSSDFLSRSVRTRLGLGHGARDYLVGDKVIARRRSGHVSFITSDCVTVEYNYLHDLARMAPRSALLWCFRSYRFTERSLSEFGSRRTSERVVRDDSLVYMKRRFNVVRGPMLSRPRMTSGTEIMGKLLVTNA